MRVLLFQFGFFLTLFAATTSRSILADDAKPATRCCFCISDYDGESQVSVLYSDESCRKLGTVSGMRGCKPVTILGDRCQLVTMKVVAGSIDCQPYPLSYLDGLKVIPIPPLRTLPSRCGKSTHDLTRPNFGSTTAAASEGESAAKRADAAPAKEEENKNVHYCNCGQDPNNLSNCELVRVEKDGSRTHFATRERKKDQLSCTDEVCGNLYQDFDSFLPRCRKRN